MYRGDDVLTTNSIIRVQECSFGHFNNFIQYINIAHGQGQNTPWVQNLEHKTTISHFYFVGITLMFRYSLNPLRRFCIVFRKYLVITQMKMLITL